MRFRAHGELTGAMRLLQPVLGRTLKRQFAQQLQTLADGLAREGTSTVL